MKKKFIVPLVLLCGIIGTYGNVNAESEAITVLDENGIYVEFRGLTQYSSQSWIVNLYVENNSNEDFYFSLRDFLANDYVTSISNNGVTVQAGSKYLSEPNFDLIIDAEDLALYGVNKISTLDFNIYCY